MRKKVDMQNPGDGNTLAEKVVTQQTLDSFVTATSSTFYYIYSYGMFPTSQSTNKTSVLSHKNASNLLFFPFFW